LEVLSQTKTRDPGTKNIIMKGREQRTLIKCRAVTVVCKMVRTSARRKIVFVFVTSPPSIQINTDRQKQIKSSIKERSQMSDRIRRRTHTQLYIRYLYIVCQAGREKLQPRESNSPAIRSASDPRKEKGRDDERRDS